MMSVRLWRPRLALAADVLLLAATVMTLAGCLAGLFPAFDLVNHMLPLWITLALTATATILMCRGWSWRVPVCLALQAAGAGPPMLREMSDEMALAQPLQQAPTLKLLQFNIFKDNATPEAVSTWILREKPDIITMEEALGSNGSILRRLRPLYPFQTSCLPGMRCSTVILSRTRPLASAGLAHGDPENRQALSAVWATFSSAGGAFTVVAVHFKRPWPWGGQESDRAELTKFLNTVDRRRFIVAGDFNLTPWTAAMSEQDLMFRMRRITHLTPTWPAMIERHSFPAMLPIDHIYTGKTWTPMLISVGPSLGSDHRPVIAVLEDRPNP